MRCTKCLLTLDVLDQGTKQERLVCPVHGLVSTSFQGQVTPRLKEIVGRKDMFGYASTCQLCGGALFDPDPSHRYHASCFSHAP